MDWENLLKKGMEVFSQETNINGDVNFMMNKPIDPFPSYYFIFNCESAEIDYISPELKNVLGYEAHEYSIRFLLDYIHSDDHPIFIQHETKALEFCKQLSADLQTKYCVMHNFRLKTKAGHYIWIQQQSYACEVKDGVLKKTMVIHSNINNFKSYHKHELHFIGLDGHPSYHNIQKSFTLYTKREQEILRLMVQGLTSLAIAKKLQRSIHTIRNHRKTILEKSKCENVQELLVKAVRESWV